jgi:hypothetical protein
MLLADYLQYAANLCFSKLEVQPPEYVDLRRKYLGHFN